MKLILEQIERMNAGREMDALIAEDIMGWTRVYGRSGLWNTQSESVRFTNDIPYYSIKIADAWKIIETMREAGYHSRVETQICPTVIFWKKGLIERGPSPVTYRATSTPLAICRAALIAVMEAE